MNLSPWILILTLFFIQIQTHNNAVQQERFFSAQAEAIASSMMVYKASATEYAAKNPTYSGNVPDSALSLPSWFNKFQGINNYVTNGTAYVYYAPSAPGLGDHLVKRTDGSITTGYKRNGQLVNPYVYTTNISLPAAIPDNTVVLF